MIPRLLLCAVGVAALAAVSCQRIPPSVSIPGYGEKEAAKAEAGAKTLGAPENPQGTSRGHDAE